MWESPESFLARLKELPCALQGEPEPTEAGKREPLWRMAHLYVVRNVFICLLAREPIALSIWTGISVGVAVHLFTQVPPMYILFSMPLLVPLLIGWVMFTALFLPPGSQCRTMRLRKDIVCEPGLYAKSGGIGEKLLKRLPQWYHDNLEKNITPWIVSGEAYTMLPYLSATFAKMWGDIDQTYRRVWIKALGEDQSTKMPLETEDGEVLSTDWAFPKQGHDPSAPVLIILHGLNGGSRSPFVRDIAKKCVKKGWTAVCFSGRGIGGLPCYKYPFHGARIADLHLVAGVVRKLCPNSLVVACGFSMGGIIVGNYLSRMGQSALVDGVVNVAGCIDINHSSKFDYCHETFTPLITHGLKMSMLLGGKFTDVAKRVNVDMDFALSSKCCSLTDFDTHIARKVAGYSCVEDYYDALSVVSIDEKSINFKNKKWLTVARPMLVVMSLDDVVVDVNHLVGHHDKNPNFAFLITRYGGHCGWPTGWWPWTDGFSKQSHFVLDFVEALKAEKGSEGRS